MPACRRRDRSSAAGCIWYSCSEPWICEPHLIEAVLVDLGGVAARFLPQRRLEALAALTSLSPALIQERWFDSGFEEQAELGAYAPDVLRDRLLALLDNPASWNAVVDAWALAFEPHAGVLERIGALRVKKVLFTNNGPMAGACLAGPLSELAARFDEVICSWQLEARKPDHAAFERAAERLACAPDHLLLLDDSPLNVAAARACSWHADCVIDEDGVSAALARYLELRR